MIRRQAIFLRDTIQGFLVLDRDIFDIAQRDVRDLRSRKDTSRSQDCDEIFDVAATY
jgi:hypothetical protein